MKGTILITDSLFIYPEHEEQIRAAGYEIERIDKPEPSAQELIAALPGKVGYLLGGIEHVTKEILDAADQLKVISLTGIGYKDFIPDWEEATRKGIAITNTPDAPTNAAAEWAVSMALAMNRGLFEIGRAGTKDFLTTKGIEGQHIGLIGFGRIGKRIADLLTPFRPASISFTSKRPDTHPGATQKELDALLAESDIIFLCVSKDAGDNFINARELALIRDGSLFITFVYPGLVHQGDLLKELSTGRICAASDYPAKDPAFNDLPFGVWYSSNSGSNAFNTKLSLKRMSDAATTSLLNVLETGTDQYKVN